MRISILTLTAMFAMPLPALAQDAPPPPGAPEIVGRTIHGTWSKTTLEDGSAAVGVGTANTSLAFICVPGAGVAMLYHPTVPMTGSIREAKSVHILFGEMSNPEKKTKGSIVEAIVGPPVDASTLLISGEGTDNMLDLSAKAVENLRMAILDNGTVVNADNFSSTGSTAAIKEFRAACPKG